MFRNKPCTRPPALSVARARQVQAARKPSPATSSAKPRPRWRKKPSLSAPARKSAATTPALAVAARNTSIAADGNCTPVAKNHLRAARHLLNCNQFAIQEGTFKSVQQVVYCQPADGARFVHGRAGFQRGPTQADPS